MKRLLAYTSSFMVLASFMISAHVFAATIDYNNIISDSVFDSTNTMTADQIDSFLNGFSNSCISTNNHFSAPDVLGYSPSTGYRYGNLVSAGTVIYHAAQGYGINPQVLIATLEKEQGLVSGSGGNVIRDGSRPGDCGALAISASVGYNCPDSLTLTSYSGFTLYGYNGTPVTSVNRTCVEHESYVGFSRQVVIAAWQFTFDRHRSEGLNNWYDNKTNWDNSDDLGFCYSGHMINSGTSKLLLCPDQDSPPPAVQYGGQYSICDPTRCVAVTIQNGATAAFYNYTPHLHGQDLFFNSFVSWWGSTQTTTPYAWGIRSQSAYTDSGMTQAFTGNTVHLAPGQKAYLQIKAVNMGNQAWTSSLINLGTSNPQDRTSVFQDPSWLNGSRPTHLLESTVAPGGIGTFNFTITAPQTVGNYDEHFNVLAEGIVWMQDPGQHFFIDVSTPVQAQATRYQLRSGEVLLTGSSLLSQDTQSTLELNKSGNLVLYNNFAPFWSTKTSSSTPKELAMQGDGNLVLYDTTGKALWASGTDGNAGAYCVLQPDGNLVLYNTTGVALWNSSTILVPNGLAYVNTRTLPTAHLLTGQQLQTANKLFRFVMQGDGNLVLYNQNNLPLWASGTDQNPGAFFNLQTDGNMVVYNKDSKPIWNSSTSGNAISQLIIQPDGNLVLYNSDYRATWQSGTIQKQLAADTTNSLRSPQQLSVGQSIVSDNQQYKTVLQGDGNLVFYNSSGKALWNSQTDGKPVTRAVLQSDGNIVLYDSAGKVYWASNTDSRGSSTLIMQNDGNLVLYDGYGHVTWHR